MHTWPVWSALGVALLATGCAVSFHDYPVGDLDASAAGASGADASTGGSAGTAGAAGTGGSAATGGAAGTGGSAGTGGAAGTGGSAGVGGSSGSGGSGGAAPCSTSVDCPPNQLCDTTHGYCVECLVQADCKSGEYCDGGACKPDVCTPLQPSCQGNSVVTCKADGSGYGTPQPCPYLCSAGACTGVCSPGTADCNGLVPRTCDASGQWQQGAACTYVCSAGQCTGQCTPGNKRCNGQTPQSCDSAGTWQDGSACPYVCNSGTCAGSCTSGSRQCSGLQPQLCDSSDQWQNDGSACQYVCSAGQCAGVCTPTSKDCNGLVPRSCDATGQWQDGTACQYVCSAGNCTGVCTPTTTRCNGLQPQTCNSSGQWGNTGSACPYVCQSASCTGVCKPGSKQCNGQIPQTCDSTGQWQDGSACSVVCVAGGCGVCTPGDKQCNGLTTQTCDSTGQWQDGATCTNPNGTTACVAGVCSPSCAANFDDCDQNPDNGCEANLLSDSANCNGCGNVCGSGKYCVAGTCTTGCVVQMEMGSYYACAVKAAGTLWCWGVNGDGELGDGTTYQRKTPVQVTALGTNVTRVAVGGGTTCAILGDGSLWCWGADRYGTIGDGTSTLSPRPTPVKISALGNDVTEVSVGNFHVCALKTDHTVWCWGDNTDGQLGTGDNTPSNTPVQVTALGTNVASISAGAYHTCAVETDHSLWCWGYNAKGELGDGSTTNRDAPVKVSSLGTSVASVGAADVDTCAIKIDGSLWCWGYNYYGELGVGSTTQHTSPVQVTSLGNITDVSGGAYHMCARRSDSALFCWGDNMEGELGNNSSVTQSYYPVAVHVIGTSGQDVAAGTFNSCARDNNNTLWCWGDNSSGQIGDGTTTLRRQPVQTLLTCP